MSRPISRTFLMYGTASALLVALAASGAALGLFASSDSQPGAASACQSAAPKLTVQGTGNATGTPNLLTISVGIDVTAPSAQASLVDDNSKATAVTTALKQGGILDKDVQTSDLSINPNYNSNGTITGYQVTNTLTAKLHDFSSAGSVIDAIAGAVGNAIRVNSLTFSVEDPRAIENQARNQAVHEAVSHAKSMAQAAGERLGPICSLSDQTPVQRSPVENGFGTAAGASSFPAPAVPLESGTQESSAQVSIVYSLER